MGTKELDQHDQQILEILQKNGRISNADIARSISLAPSATLERVRRLENRGYIRGYYALLSSEKMECNLAAYIHVKQKSETSCDKTCKSLSLLPEVQEVHSVAGEDCIMIKVRAKDTSHLNTILRDKIVNLEAVSSTRTIIVLETFKECLDLAIPSSSE